MTMNNLRHRMVLALAVPLLFSACSDRADLTVAQGTGPDPELPPPSTKTIPTINVAKAVGWPSDVLPVPAQGLAVNVFAAGLEHPRWLYVLPNGDVLVAETNSPARADDGGGLEAWVAKRMMKKAGAAVPSPDRITLLRDADGDGKAEMRSVFLDNMTSPFGMTLIGDMLYVANTDSLMRFRYTQGMTALHETGEMVTKLPAGPINHHWTKNVIATKDGSRLYVTVGSNSNIAENGMENEVERAAVLEIDPETGKTRVFASGLRNPNGLGWEPYSGELWTTVNERDLLGSDLVPDYMTALQDGGFYGWPYSYFGQHVDQRVRPQRPDLVASALVPDYALGPHTAPLGLVFYFDGPLPADFSNGAFVAQHGSWNRKPHSGYQVIFIAFENGQPSGQPQVALSGFLNADEEAYGRPTGLAVDKQGNLLVADDVGNTIWRLSKTSTDPNAIDLEGTWKIEGKENFERWQTMPNGNLIGESYKQVDAKKIVLETLSLRIQADKTIYEATVLDQNDGQTVAFTLNDEVKNALSFENLSHDFPTKIVYKFENPHRLFVEVQGANGNGFSFYMNRQD